MDNVVSVFYNKEEKTFVLHTPEIMTIISKEEAKKLAKSITDKIDHEFIPDSKKFGKL